jgi:hypothetical protein
LPANKQHPFQRAVRADPSLPLSPGHAGKPDRWTSSGKGNYRYGMIIDVSMGSRRNASPGADGLPG